MFELLKKLCETPGVSGAEHMVSEILLKEIKGHAECTVDRLGNILAFKKGSRRAETRLMLCAHMDEVGLIVTQVTDEGFLKFAPVGGIDPRVVLGSRVVFAGGETRGVIGTKAVHMLSAEEKKESPSFDALFIDIGAASGEDALRYVSPGDTSVFDTGYAGFGDGLIKARALDDRAGCAILAELIKTDLPYDCHFAFTVQEEVGLRGARVAAFTLRPEAALVIDATTAADIPFVDDYNKVCHLGQGPVIGFMDKHTVYDRGMFELARAVSAEKGITSQIKKAVAGGNDAGAIHISNGGVRTLAVSLPCRYLHSPTCVIRSDDATGTLRLVAELSAAVAGKPPC